MKKHPIRSLTEKVSIRGSKSAFYFCCSQTAQTAVVTGGDQADLQGAVNTANCHPLLLRGERVLLQTDVLLLEALQPHLEDTSTAGSETQPDHTPRDQETLGTVR